MTTETESSTLQAVHYKATVNRGAVPFRDPMPDARQILNKANFMPADECVLIQVLKQGTRAIGLDQTVDLRKAGTEVFWAFRSDRIYRFTISERGFDWGEEKLKEPMLREIAPIGDDEVFVLEREDHPDKELEPNDEIDLSRVGTEHIKVRKRLVKVFFKNKPYHLPPGIYTTEELIAQFPVEEGYLLNLKNEGGELVTLQPGQETAIKSGMHFYSQVPGGGSS